MQRQRSDRSLVKAGSIWSSKAILANEMAIDR
jgi:hypothetical protein